MQFQQDWRKDKKITALSIFWWKTEKFRSTELYGARLEGLTIFLNRSSTCRMSMESYQLAELKYAISAGQDVRLKNYPARSSFFGRSLSMDS